MSDGRDRQILDGERTRERIIEQAVRLIAAGGYHRGVFMEVAAAIGVSPATIAYHFQTREILLQAVIVHLQGARQRMLQAAAAHAPCGAARIDYAIDVYGRMLEDPVFVAFAEMERLARVDPAIEATLSVAQAAFDRAEHPAAFDLVQSGGEPRLQTGRDIARLTLEGLSCARLSFDAEHRRKDLFALLKRTARMLSREDAPEAS